MQQTVQYARGGTWLFQRAVHLDRSQVQNTLCLSTRSDLRLVRILCLCLSSTIRRTWKEGAIGLISNWNTRNKKVLKEMVKEKDDRRLNKICVCAGPRTWIQSGCQAALFLTSGSVIPFATQFLPGYINGESMFHLKHNSKP